MSMFSAALWVVRASRVLVMTSPASRTSSCGGLSKPRRVVRKFVSARRRNQVAASTAPQNCHAGSRELAGVLVP